MSEIDPNPENHEKSLTSDRSKILFWLCIWFHDIVYDPTTEDKSEGKQ